MSKANILSKAIVPLQRTAEQNTSATFKVTESTGAERVEAIQYGLEGRDFECQVHVRRWKYKYEFVSLELQVTSAFAQHQPLQVLSCQLGELL